MAFMGSSWGVDTQRALAQEAAQRRAELGWEREPGLRALEKQQDWPCAEPAPAPMGSCVGRWCLTPGDQVCAGEGSPEGGGTSCLPVSEAGKSVDLESLNSQLKRSWGTRPETSLLQTSVLTCKMA